MHYLHRAVTAALTTSALLLSGVTFAASTATPAAAPQLSKILETLHQQGYNGIHDVEREDGILTVEGVKKDGVKYEIDIDPHTGDILKKQHHIKTKLSVLEVAKMLEAKGYTKINEIEFDDGAYHVEAVDSNHKEVELCIDPNSGKIED